MLGMSAFILRQKMIIKKLEDAEAVSENSAKTLADIGVPYPNVFPKVTEDLERKNILVKTNGGKYYLNVQSEFLR